MCTDKKIEELVTIARGFLGEKTNIPKNFVLPKVNLDFFRKAYKVV